MTAEQLESFIKEVEIMSNIFAPNINLFMGACTIPGKIMMVTELLEGDLETILRDPSKNVSLYDRMKMARDAAQGVAWLHGANPPIIHRDLKSSNLLFDKNKRIKVCDFGFSQFFQKGKKVVDEEGAKGTPLYMAPEVMTGEEFNEKADVYSFGIVLWEILCRKEPFSHHSDFEVFVEAVCDHNERPPLPADCLASLRELICRCWEGNPAHRPSFPQIVDSIEGIIVDCATDDNDARKLWKEFFFRKEAVAWREEFVPVFAQLLGKKIIADPNDEEEFLAEIDDIIKSVPYQCLQAVLAERKDGNLFVNLERFGQVISWFGPMKGKQNVLDRLEAVLREPWFHGELSASDAVNRLIKKIKCPGTFLIRFSGKENPGAFTISKVNAQGKVIHQRISHKTGGDFILENKPFKSLHDMIEKAGKTLGLNEPEPSDNFVHIFTACDTSSLYE